MPARNVYFSRAQPVAARALSAEVFAAPGYPETMRPVLDYAPALQELRDFEVRYLVVHKNLLAKLKSARAEVALHRAQLPVVFEDADTRVYSLQNGEF